MKTTLMMALIVYFAIGNAASAQSNDDEEGSKSAKGATVEFLNIKNNQKVPRGTIIYFGLSKMGIAPAGVDKQNTGHHHLLIDEAAHDLPPANEEIPADANHVHFGGGQTEYQLDLEPGPHDLRLLLGDAGHKPFKKSVVSKIVHIIVVDKGKLDDDTSDAVETSLVKDCDDCDELVLLPAGKFRMGAKNDKAKALHTVQIKSFALAARPVTFKQWQVCVDDGGCDFMPDDHGWGAGERPIIGLSWNDTEQYVQWISEKTSKTYRLPSEAEWEYAARAGSTLPYWWGSDVETDHANCKECSSDTEMQTVEVGTFSSNPWGFFDQSGNSAEWVQDCWHHSYKGAPTDGAAWMKGGDCSYHVLRGGYFGSSADDVKTSARSRYDTDVRYYANGFRVARDAE